MPALEDETIFESLSAKRIFFGHQSVGYNIIEGIQDLQGDKEGSKIAISEISDQSDIFSYGINHFKVGSNKDPISKIEAFKQFVQKIKPGEGDVVFFKLCYVDIIPETKIHEVFSAYKETMLVLKEQYPGAKFVHVTVPLGISIPTWKTKIKQLLGISIWGFENNIARNQYNDLLIEEYDGKEPIFDLAKIESTYPDGSRSIFKDSGKEYYSLVPEYTYDYGHLNELGRGRVAKELLVALVNLK